MSFSNGAAKRAPMHGLVPVDDVVSRSIRACAIAARSIQDRSHGCIMIAITDAGQSTYRGLRAGDRVLIDGMLAPNRQHVIAGDIERDDKRGAWSRRADRLARSVTRDRLWRGATAYPSRVGAG